MRTTGRPCREPAGVAAVEWRRAEAVVRWGCRYLNTPSSMLTQSYNGCPLSPACAEYRGVLSMHPLIAHRPLGYH